MAAAGGCIISRKRNIMPEGCLMLPKGQHIIYKKEFSCYGDYLPRSAH